VDIEPRLTCSNALWRVQNRGFSLVSAQFASQFPLLSDARSTARLLASHSNTGICLHTCISAEGNLWVTTVVRNGLGVLTRDGDWHVVPEDPREDVLAAFVDKLAAGTATPDDLAAAAGPGLQFLTSVCFGGQDLRTAFVGSLAMSRLSNLPLPGPWPADEPLALSHPESVVRAEPTGSGEREAAHGPHGGSTKPMTSANAGHLTSGPGRPGQGGPSAPSPRPSPG
jgi:hypothetical protein